MNELAEKLETCLEKIEEFVSNHKHLSKELIKAKESFTETFGVVKKDSLEEYSNLMNSFLVWFIFDYRSGTYKKSPYELFMDQTPDLEKIYNELFPNHHSLFLLLKKKKDGCLLQDVFTRDKILVSNEELLGIDKDSLFEARIFSLNDGHCFGNFFFVHPEKMRKKITKHIKTKKWKEDQKYQFLLELKKYHSRWTHYKYIDVESIYQF